MSSESASNIIIRWKVYRDGIAMQWVSIEEYACVLSASSRAGQTIQWQLSINSKKGSWPLT